MAHKIFPVFILFIIPFKILAFKLPSNEPSARTIYTVDFFRLVQGTFELSREKPFTKNRSLHIALLGTYASTKGLAKPYLEAQDFSYTKSYTGIDQRSKELRGGGVNIQVRNYLGKNPTLFEGFFLSSEFIARYLFINSLVYDYELESERELNSEMIQGYLGYNVGWQKIFRHVVSLDFHVGGGFWYSKYSNEKKPTKYQQSYQLDYTGFFFNSGILVGIII
ncbi:MAG: hypothetical protein A3G23_12395 [Bacteroidetes bacterium RIFCSPLOWO2_12_FULL_37_12]|nr:MAG: hypothetical protein A3G23_12395 [Bacteroidetes bacterium RIFCSPLOWO2_12_FULL_37_12]